MSAPRQPPPVALCAFDGTSKLPGTAHAPAIVWRNLLRAHPAWAEIPAVEVASETRSPAVWCERLREVAARRDVRLAIGGEHILLFPLVQNAQRRWENLKVVTLDAHHDAYPYELLTHYSILSHLQSELGIESLVLGARYELDAASKGVAQLQGDPDAMLRAARSFIGESAFYLSIDVDVMDPERFPAVSSPVPGGFMPEETIELVRALAALGPVGCDVVEYNPLKDDVSSRSLGIVVELVDALRPWLEATPAVPAPALTAPRVTFVRYYRGAVLAHGEAEIRLTEEEARRFEATFGGCCVADELRARAPGLYGRLMGGTGRRDDGGGGEREPR